MHHKTADKLFMAQNHLLLMPFGGNLCKKKVTVSASIFLILWLLMAILCVYLPKYSTTDFGLPKGFFGVNNPRLFPQILPDFGILFKVFIF